MTTTGGRTSVSVRPHVPPALRRYDALDANDHAWAEPKLAAMARAPLLPFFIGGIAGSALFLSRVFPMAVALGMFVSIPALGLINLARQRRAFIQQAAAHGIHESAARRLLVEGPRGRRGPPT